MPEPCIDPEVRKMLKEKLDYEIHKHERLAEEFNLKKSMELLPKLRALNEVVETAQSCTDILMYREHMVPETRQRKHSPRMEFMGSCMRSPAKGGEGKGMSECSTEWREKGGK